LKVHSLLSWRRKMTPAMRSPQRLDFAQLPNQLPRRNRKVMLHL